MQPTPLSKVSNLIFSKVSPLPPLKGSAFSQRFSTMLSKVSKQPFLKRVLQHRQNGIYQHHLSQRFQPSPKSSQSWYHSSGTREKLSLVNKRCNKIQYLGLTFFGIVCLICHQGRLKIPAVTFWIHCPHWQNTEKLWGSKK